MSWIGAAILAAVAYGVWAYFIRAGVVVGPWKEVLFWAVVTEAAIIGAITRPTGISSSAILPGCIAGACAAGGYVAYTYSTSVSMSITPVMIMHAYPLLTAGLAFVLLGEPMSAIRWVGVALAIVGVVMVSKG